jgi:hypothetical protein
MPRHRFFLTATAVLLFSGLISGCGSGQRVSPPPVTHKTEGVVLKKDGKPVTGGSVEFRHATMPEFVSLGDVGADGRFTLRTMGGNQDASGGQEGEHTVTYTPPLNAQGETNSIMLSKKYTIKSGDNNITVTLE